MNTYQPLLDLLTGKFGWLTTVLVWVGALRLPMKLVSARLQQFLTRFVADVAASPETDDDAALRRVLGSLWYRFPAFALDAALSLKLPTTESLDRHVETLNPEVTLTPALSHPMGEGAQSASRESSNGHGNADALTAILPLPKGEGRGEGEVPIEKSTPVEITHNLPATRIPNLLLLTILYSLLNFSTGCVTQQPPPSSLEQKLFTVQTNYLPVVVLQTNMAVATNLLPQYAFSPNTNAAAIAQTVGSVGNFWGVGGITGTVAGALFSLWAWYRSRQAGLSAAALAQVIETGRQILLSLPNGEQYDEAWKTWMIQHQAEAGVIAQVAKIVGNVVDSDSARGAAQEIVDLIESQLPEKP